MGTSILLLFLAPLMTVYAAFQGIADIIGFNSIFEKLEQIIDYNPDAIIDLYIWLQGAVGNIGILIGMFTN